MRALKQAWGYVGGREKYVEFKIVPFVRSGDGITPIKLRTPEILGALKLEEEQMIDMSVGFYSLVSPGLRMVVCNPVNEIISANRFDDKGESRNICFPPEVRRVVRMPDESVLVIPSPDRYHYLCFRVGRLQSWLEENGIARR